MCRTYLGIFNANGYHNVNVSFVQVNIEGLAITMVCNKSKFTQYNGTLFRIGNDDPIIICRACLTLHVIRYEKILILPGRLPIH